MISSRENLVNNALNFRHKFKSLVTVKFGVVNANKNMLSI
jgi:hypothetical protein